jgi:hypothetical protein
MDNEDGASPASLETRSRAEGGCAVDWADVRRAYEETSEPVAAIVRRLGLTHRKLRYRREKEGWAIRPHGPGASIVLNGWAAEQLRRLLIVHGMLTGRLAAAVTATDELKLEHVEAMLMQAKSRRALIRPERGKMQKCRKSAKKPRKPDGTEKKNNNAGLDRTDDIAFIRAELKRRVARILEAEEGNSGS